MLCRLRSLRQQLCAPALVVALMFAAPLAVCAQGDWSVGYLQPVKYEAQAPPPVANTDGPNDFILTVSDSSDWLVNQTAGSEPRIAQLSPEGQFWIAPPNGGTVVETLPPANGDGYWIEPHTNGPVYFDDGPPVWTWQVLPDGIIYRSYMAGVRESRMSVVAFEERDGRSLWDATIGGRVGILRYGDCNPIRPQGWQLDFEGAAIMRFTFDRARDFETADYRAGVPITYGIGDWQYKLGYYHLSSHMGDEFAIRNPGAFSDRINYVRDALVLGASYFPNPVWRLYGEAAYALKADGGADPWEFQFGTELSQPGPTGRRGVPFFAVNVNLREEHDFGGDITTQVGWLWRGRDGQTARVGFHYFNGKSSQYQTFDDSEEHIGAGVWYDF